jgi:small subunit ribosomal protein S8
LVSEKLEVEEAKEVKNMQMDTLADALTSILNAEKTGKKTVTVKPASKTIANVLRTVQRAGYLGELEYIENNRGGMFEIQLLGRINKCGVIKPRFPVKRNQLEEEERKYLPARGFGVLIVTTSEGVMSHEDAKQKNIGGRLLAYIY